jgi:ribulose-5-phosphate 4-epimerase/fuculose-1-phosphate aldolase
VLDEQEGKNIAAALGANKKAVILQNHGLITLSTTIEGTVHLFMRLEECCRCQLLAYSSAQKPVLICKCSGEIDMKLNK